jgi:hypothetical protein
MQRRVARRIQRDGEQGGKDVVEHLGERRDIAIFPIKERDIKGDQMTDYIRAEREG